MLTQTSFGGIGLIAALVLGWFCECFLRKSVKAQPEIGSHEAGGGGKQLGTLERILFFGSFLLAEYSIAAGWLAFKVAAKWASWQHVVRIPDNDLDPGLKERITLSSRLLGRFLNGTLYNGLCAYVGVAIVQFASYLLKDWVNSLFPEWLHWLITMAIVCVLVGIVFASLFRNWPSFCEKDDPVRSGAPGEPE
jgi:hypothetical protein